MRIFFDIDGTLLDHKYSERAGVLEFSVIISTLSSILDKRNFTRCGVVFPINILLDS